jgi:hypothetical protein
MFRGRVLLDADCTATTLIAVESMLCETVRRAVAELQTNPQGAVRESIHLEIRSN